MRKKYIFGKKLYISVLTSILVLLTTVATTFAWVGVFANSTFETFDIGIKGSNLVEYGIEISATGEEGTFSDSIPFIDIKKQILINCGYDASDLSSETIINNVFNSLDLDQCTTIPNIEDNKIVSLGTFKDLYNFETKLLFKFDIYVSAKKNYDSGSSDFKLDAYLNKGLMTGHVKDHDLINKYTYPEDFINPLSNTTLPSNVVPLVAGDVITTARTDSSSSARVAFEKYKVVSKYHPEEYTDSSTPKSAVIYQTGSDYPLMYTDTGVHSFGGILKDEYSVSTTYYNSTEWRFYNSKGFIKTISISDEMYNARGVDSVTKDLTLSSNNNHLIDSNNPNEQIGIDQMMKITCYFWFEGWDADCIPSLNFSPVDINIVLNMTNDEEF